MTDSREIDPASPKIGLQLAIAGRRDPEDQEELAFGLLNGFIENGERCYWEDDSAEERRARVALANLLRGQEPLDRHLRVQLAALISPQGSEVGIVKRKIVFKNVKAGHPVDDYRNTQIVKYIYDLAATDKSINKSVEQAAEKYGLGIRRIKKLWGEYRDQLLSIHGPLPRSPRVRKVRPSSGAPK
jgi:hypothetical protein